MLRHPTNLCACSISRALKLPWKRIGGSFLLMFSIYWIYALAIVPFIEPTAEAPPEVDDCVKPNAGRQERRRSAARVLSPWFKPGDWELTSPKVFESPRGKLLLHDYETLADGRLHIRPCTLIFLSEGEADTPEERNCRRGNLAGSRGSNSEIRHAGRPEADEDRQTRRRHHDGANHDS